MSDDFTPATRVVTERGIKIHSGDDDTFLFVTEDTLVQLAEQGRWDSQFGKSPVTLTPAEGWALVQVGFAEQETRGGYHGTDVLREHLTKWGWM